MKKNQMEVMRAARNAALADGVNFVTLNLRSKDGKKSAGNVIAAYRKISLKDGVSPQELLSVNLDKRRIYRIQFSYCSPSQKNPSRIFGEGQASLRFQNDKSAMALEIGKALTLTDGLRQAAIDYSKKRNVPWLNGKTAEDLV